MNNCPFCQNILIDDRISLSKACPTKIKYRGIAHSHFYFFSEGVYNVVFHDSFIKVDQTSATLIKGDDWTEIEFLKDPQLMCERIALIQFYQ